MIRSFFLLLFSCITFSTLAQLNPALYDTDLLTGEFHTGRREALREKMPDKSIAVFFAGPMKNRANDVDYEFHQDPDFYYLTGYNEPNAVLFITKENVRLGDIEANEFIFVQDRNPKAENWTGRRLGISGAQLVSGIKQVYLNSDFQDFPIAFSEFNTILSANPDDLPLLEKADKNDYYSLLNQYRNKTGTIHGQIDSRSLKKLMAELREIKLADEMVLLQRAIDITAEAHKKVMETLEPGMTEYQVEALLEYVFKQKGAEEPGFPSIVGGGENSCILHYVSNRRKLESSNMLVVDIGAEYHGYTADVTRTLPVDGTFSAEEAAIYQIVYDAQAAGIEACKPGAHFWAAHAAASEVIKKELSRLGITKSESQYVKYFTHGTSHYLGLDVHDAGTYGPLKPGSVITVEPGIYIPEGSDCDPKWWNIGVRIEDDVLITESGHTVLSAAAPRTIAEIEKLMAPQP